MTSNYQTARLTQSKLQEADRLPRDWASPQRRYVILTNRTMNPFDAVLAYISQQCYYINEDNLCEVLNECGLPIVAKLL